MIFSTFYYACLTNAIKFEVSSTSVLDLWGQTGRTDRQTAPFRNTIHKPVVVPAKWHRHFGHVNRFTYLLTYLRPCTDRPYILPNRKSGGRQ